MINNLINKWKDKIVQYLDVHLRLIKLNFIERTSNVLSYILFVMLALFIFFAVLLFVGLGLAELLSDLFQSRTGGFFGAAGFFLIVLLIAIALNERISKWFSVIFIRILTSKGDDDDDEDEKANPEEKAKS